MAGEFLGAASGLLLTGEMAAWWTWRGAFWVLAIPGPVPAVALLRHLTEPLRGGAESPPPTALVAGQRDGPADAAEQPTLTRLVTNAGVQPALTPNQGVGPGLWQGGSGQRQTVRAVRVRRTQGIFDHYTRSARRGSDAQQ